MEKTRRGTVIGAVKGDITKHDEMDTWVLGADTSLYLDSGVCKAIHKVAGPALLEAVKKTGGRELGEAVITPAFDAPCKTIIHAAVPKWNDGEGNVKDLLFSVFTKKRARFSLGIRRRGGRDLLTIKSAFGILYFV